MKSKEHGCELTGSTTRRTARSLLLAAARCQVAVAAQWRRKQVLARPVHHQPPDNRAEPTLHHVVAVCVLRHLLCVDCYPCSASRSGSPGARSAPAVGSLCCFVHSSWTVQSFHCMRMVMSCSIRPSSNETHRACRVVLRCYIALHHQRPCLQLQGMTCQEEWVVLVTRPLSPDPISTQYAGAAAGPTCHGDIK